jgi:hypothetical protein
VGSSILASLSEAGGNDRHTSWSKPLPPRSKMHEDRLPECVHVYLHSMRVSNLVFISPFSISLFLLMFRPSFSQSPLRLSQTESCFGSEPPASGIVKYDDKSPNCPMLIFFCHEARQVLAVRRRPGPYFGKSLILLTRRDYVQSRFGTYPAFMCRRKI